MQRYVFFRLIQALLVLFVVYSITFFMIQIAPGGPSILLDPELDLETSEQIRHNLGLDQPIYVQYVRWLSGAIRGDLGRSLVSRRPVRSMVLERMPATLLLSSVSLLFAIVIGISLGVLAAKLHYSIYDHLATVVSFLGVSMPGFWMGIMLIFLFSVRLRVLPSAGMYTIGADFSLTDRLTHIIMPSFVLGTGALAQITRFTRSSMLDVMAQDYVRTARAKGLSELAVTFGHGLRNALIPIVTVIGLRLPLLVGGAAITEAIFGWPGIGRLAVDAAYHRDYPVVMGVTILVSVMVVLTNVLIDVLYAYIDPRIRLE